MTGADTTIEGPVTFVVSREVKPSSIEEYEKWVEDLGSAARVLDPNLTMTVIKPTGAARGTYVVVLHFSSQQQLDQWEGSDAQKELNKRVRSMEAGKATFKEVTGFEYWFSLPKVAATRPPARFKMALVTVLGLYILSVCYMYTINKWLAGLPDHAGLILKIVVLVVLMTFLVMPLLTRLCARWLYPRSERNKL